MEEIAEIDLSEQIDNRWNKDTAIVIKKKGLYYSVKIRSKDKNDLKSRFIKKVERNLDRKNNRRVIVIIYSFILYHLLKLSGNLSKRVKICNDVSPRWAINNYLVAICRQYDEHPITDRIKISFREKRDGKSKAHYIARDVAKGRKPANFILKKPHIDKLKHIIRTLI